MMWKRSVWNWRKVTTFLSYSYGLLQCVNMELVKPVEPVLWAWTVELVMGGTGYGTVEPLQVTSSFMMSWPQRNRDELPLFSFRLSSLIPQLWLTVITVFEPRHLTASTNKGHLQHRHWVKRYTRGVKVQGEMLSQGWSKWKYAGKGS